MDGWWIVLALSVAFLWGLSPIVHKSFLNQQVSRESLIVFGGAAYAACVLVYAIWHRKQLLADARRITPSFWGVIAVTSIICGFLANLIYFAILKYNPSYLIVALTSCSPIFTLGMAYWLLEEEATLTAVLGVLLIVAGIVLVSAG